MSHPVWVRGLKLNESVTLHPEYSVAPRVGAWIETREDLRSSDLRPGRTPCGCVD